MKERVLSSYSFEKQPEGIISEYSLESLREKKEADLRKFDPSSVKTKFIGNDDKNTLIYRVAQKKYSSLI